MESVDLRRVARTDRHAKLPKRIVQLQVIFTLLNVDLRRVARTDRHAKLPKRIVQHQVVFTLLNGGLTTGDTDW